MAQSKLTPQEYIKNAFKPQIAALCSPSAAQICNKNNITFTEMIQPFCKLGSDVFYKDFSGQVITIHNLEITVLDVNFRPPQPTLARKFLNASVTNAPEPRFQQLTVNEYSLSIPITAPWFEEWRETFLQMQYPSDHEFTKHFLACIFVISTVDNPLDMINQLSHTLKLNQSEKPTKLPKWFFQDILKYYVIIHDNFDGVSINFHKAFDSLKDSYGVSNCFLLRMNSRPPGQGNEQLPDPWSQFLTNKIRQQSQKGTFQENSPIISRSIESVQEFENNIGKLPYHPLSPDMEDFRINEVTNDTDIFDEDVSNSVHGLCLSTEDVETIKLFVREFCTRALIPYIERKFSYLQQFFVNKSITSSSFLSDPRKWFKSNKPSKNSTANDIFIYRPDSSELLMRKMGDLCFMFGNYGGACQAYSYCRNDFLRDGAWLYYAGAIEMYILSAFMAAEQPRKIFKEMEESVRTYLDICKMPQFATRATLLIFECLKGHKLYGEAAHQLIRMTSEDSDLRSALLLEQAAYCFLNSTPKLIRKYAFHMVLAGHRYSKAMQKRHALRCYNQALQIFKKRSWHLAEDHINFTIGKLASSLNLLEEATEAFSMLNTASKQSSQQQASFLKEYLTIRNLLLKKERKIRATNLPLPSLDSDSLKVLVGPAPPLSIPGKSPALGITFSSCYDQETSQKWNKLEEMLVQEAQGSLPLLFKPLVSLYTKENISSNDAIAIVGEPIQISVKLMNPLDIPLYLKDVHLHWVFVSKDNIESTNDNSKTNPENYVKTFTLKNLEMKAKSIEELILSVTPVCVGQITLKGVAFCLLNCTNGEESISLHGELQLFMKNTMPTKKEEEGVKQEKEIEIKVVPSAPCLQVTFVEVNTDTLCDEIQEIPMEIKNVGCTPVNKVLMAVSTPDLVSVCEFSKEYPKITNNNIETPALKEKELRKLHITRLPLPNNVLDPEQMHTINLWIKAPSTKGHKNIDILIYYENTNSNSIPRYRLVRHTWKLLSQESLSARVKCQESFNSRSVEQLSLSAKATNLTKSHHLKTINIAVSKVVLLSSSWILLDDVVVPSCPKIGPEQSFYLLLKAKRNSKRQETFSSISLEPDNKRPAITDEVCLDFARKTCDCIPNLFEDVLSIETNEKNDTQQGYVILQWKASLSDNSSHKRSVTGQTLAPIAFKEESDIDTSLSYEANLILDLTASINKSDSQTDIKNQVLYNLVHPAIVRHNFQNNKVCITPVKLLVHNMVNEELTVIVNTLGSSSDSPPPSHRPSYFYQYPSKYFRWVGKSSAVKSLKPFSSQTITLFVAIFEPGTYDLGARLEIWCHGIEQPDNMVLQSCRAESALIVKNP